MSFLHTFDPEIVILGGNIAAAGPQLIAPIQDKIARRTKILLGREVPIVFQKIVGYGGVAGAAGLVFLEQGLLAILSEDWARVLGGVQERSRLQCDYGSNYTDARIR